MARVPLGQLTNYDAPGENAKPPKLLLAVGHPPAVADAILSLFRTLVKGSVGIRERKLATLAVAAEAGNTYEWGHHATSALDLGITAVEVESIKSHTTGVLSERDQLTVDFARAVERGAVTDELWTNVSGRYELDELVQLTVISGYYGMLARIQEALDVEQDLGIAGSS